MRILHAVLLVFLFQVAHAQQPVELKPIIEVAGADSGAELGWYLKGVGDLNKDGFADVAVSAPRRLRTFVYYGGRPMSSQPALSVAGGGHITWGDFNGDGWTDLAIEKWFRDTVYVYYGRAAMDTIPDVVLSQDSDYFGHPFAAGDVNGDGYTDLVIPTLDVNTRDTSLYLRGRIFIYAGGPQFSQTPVRVLAGDTIKAGLGWDITTGDVNGDGRKDIIALGYNQVSSLGSGKFYYVSVFFGDSVFHLNRNYYIDARRVPGGFEQHVASFDADGDGIDDILVNKIYIFKGGSQLDALPSYYVAPPYNSTENFGPYPWASGGGDYNKDGVKDILLSSSQGYFGVVPGVFVMLGKQGSPGQWAAYRVFADYLRFPLEGGRPENAGDVNGDGVDDIIVGSPGEPFGKSNGFFAIYSGDPSLVVSVGRDESGRVDAYRLEQNFPNPFNPETVIEYILPRADFVAVSIFNVSGQEIRSLVNELRPAGTHRLLWDGKDSSGRKVASGVYFYQLRTESFSDTKKLLYLK